MVIKTYQLGRGTADVRRFVLHLSLVCALACALCVGVPSHTSALQSGRTLGLWDKLDSNQQDLFSQNNVVFYDPTECIEGDKNESTSEIDLSNNRDYAGNQIWSDKQLQALKANQPFYEKAAKAAGIPWQALAAIHLREHGLARDNPGNGQGAYQFYSAKCSGGDFSPGKISDEQFQIQTNCAAVALRDSYGLKRADDNTVKKAFFSYNGQATAYINQAKNLGFTDAQAKIGEGSPYVMNKYDEKRDPSKNKNWCQIKTDGGSLSCPANQDYGAFVYYKAIGGGSNSGSLISTTGSTTSSDDDSEGRSTSSISNAGDAINDTAIELAWPENSGHAYTDPKPAYKKAFIAKGFQAGDLCRGADCGAFVSTVLHASGVDKDFTKSGVSGQIKYMEDHPEKYEEIKGWTISSAQPGDIQAYVSGEEGHIRIVVKVNNSMKLAHASECDRTAEITPMYNDSNLYRVFRVRGDTINEGECSGGSSGNMDINKTAIELAWPKGEKHGATDPKPEYVKALDEVYGKDRGSCEQYGANCGMYVSTVLRYSGADPGFGKGDYSGWAYTFGLYMLDHPELYEDVTEGYGKDTMRAGDIQIMKGNGWDNRSKPNIRGGEVNHARLVIQYTDGKFYIAEASQCQRTAEINGSEYDGKISKATKVFRLKTSVQSSPTISTDTSKSNGSMSISKTALELAWPKGTACTEKSTPEYYNARMAVGIATSTVKKGNYPCAAIGASCDKFVGVVIRYSGIDPKAGKDVCEEGDTGQNCIVGRALAHPEIYEEVTDGYSDETAQDGDILAAPGHAWVIAKLDDGKLYRVEASYTNCCTGRVTGEYHHKAVAYKGKVHVFRAKNQANNVNCCKTDDASADGEDGESGSAVAGQIKDGGFKTEAEAERAIIRPYKNTSNSDILSHGVCNSASCISGCSNTSGAGRYNCSAFSTYFVNKYTTIKGKATQKMGYATVEHLISKGFKNGGHTPQVYAVFSQKGSACNFGSSNHTGVVLGINKAKNQAIIGHAACRGGWAKVQTVSLSCISKAPFTYAYPPGMKGLSNT